MKRILSSVMLALSLCASPLLMAEMVNINKATAAALQENLKGVGTKKAQAIVNYRKEHGPFKTLDEIMEVKGIGEGIFKKIKADISLDKGVTSLGNKTETKIDKKTNSKKIEKKADADDKKKAKQKVTDKDKKQPKTSENQKDSIKKPANS